MNGYYSRLTIDIDGYYDGTRTTGEDFRLRAVRSYYNLQQVADRVDVGVSSSGEGIHMMAFFDDIDDPMAQEELTRLRRMHGDDWKRSALDEVRMEEGAVHDVLWTEKGARDGAEADWSGEGIWDALDIVEVNMRSDYEVVRSVASEGVRSITEMSGVRPDRVELP